jgi:hypothetical protein
MITVEPRTQLGTCKRCNAHVLELCASFMGVEVVEYECRKCGHKDRETWEQMDAYGNPKFGSPESYPEMV